LIRFDVLLARRCIMRASANLGLAGSGSRGKCFAWRGSQRPRPIEILRSLRVDDEIAAMARAIAAQRERAAMAPPFVVHVAAIGIGREPFATAKLSPPM
jgi:hypothetical protein